MKIALIISAASRHEKDYRDYLIGQLAAIGYEVVTFGRKWQPEEADVLVAVFDGRPLTALDGARIGWFRRLADSSKSFPKKLVVGYQYAGGSDDDLKSSGVFDHLAKTELNLIYCLKDYIYITNKHGK